MFVALLVHCVAFVPPSTALSLPLLRLRGGDMPLATSAAPVIASALTNVMLFNSTAQTQDGAEASAAPLLFGVLLSWTVYGCLTRDAFIIVASVPGLVAAMRLVASCLRVATPTAAPKRERQLVAMAALHATVAALCAFMPSRESAATVYGVLNNLLVLVLLFCGAPAMNGLLEASRERLRVYLRQAIMCAVAAAAWALYAVAIGDVYLLAPSALTLLFAVAQTIGITLLATTSVRASTDSYQSQRAPSWLRGAFGGILVVLTAGYYGAPLSWR